jgi:beta-lactamase class A
VAVVSLPPPAIVSPAPRQVSFGRVKGRAAPGTRRVLVRVDGRLVAAKNVHRRRFVFDVPLPRRDVTLRVTAVGAGGRRSSTRIGPVFGLPREAAPDAPAPSLRGYEDPALARKVRGLARGFPGVCGLFVQDLQTGAGAAWNARARFPAASTLKLAIAVELLRRLYSVPAPGTRFANLLRQMLVYSDDRAANELLIAIGGSTSGGSARVNTMMRTLGMADSDMYGGYIVEEELIARSPIPLEIFARPSFIGKATTAWDMARLERALHLAAGARGALVRRFRGAFIPADARFLLYLLAHARTRGGLTYVRGRGVTVLHKAGWIEKARHDTGLVYSRDGAFVVTVFTWNGSGVGSASDILASRVARAALNRFGR